MTDTLISVAELAATAADTVIVDCRFSLADTTRGRHDYDAAHIPGAVYADLDRDLSTRNPALGRHPLPRVVDFARTLARWGWEPGRNIVAYDDATGAIAARLWWMLRLAHIRGGKVLDGGWAAWQAAGQPVSNEVPQPQAGITAIDFDPRQVVYCDELEARLAEPQTLLLDARAAPRYRGENEPIDPVAGHIPGAHNRPFMDNLVDGHFKSREQLRAEFTRVLGHHAPSDVLHSCGSGVTACANLLAMEHAGLAGSRVFAPSWSGWIADGKRPIATGSAP